MGQFCGSARALQRARTLFRLARAWGLPDLLDPERKELRAKDGDVAASRAFYVAKANVARALWNRLRRVRATAPEGNAPTRRATATRESKDAPAARRARPATAARKGLEVRGRSDTRTRHVDQGDNERRGGSERSERRGASAVRSTAAALRHLSSCAPHPSASEVSSGPTHAALLFSAARALQASGMAVKRKRAVRDFTDFILDDIEKLPVIEPGSRLTPGAVYLDLLDPERAELRAKDGDIARSRSLYVAKSHVARALWNRLRRERPSTVRSTAATRSTTAARSTAARRE